MFPLPCIFILIVVPAKAGTHVSGNVHRLRVPTKWKRCVGPRIRGDDKNFCVSTRANGPETQA